MSDIQVFLPMGGQRGSVLGPLDGALEYLRRRGGRLLPLYLWANAPLAAAVLVMIDTVTAQHRSALPDAAWMLTGAMVWRWVWQGLVQKRVQEDLRGQPVLPLRRRALSLLMTRLICFVLITWGSFLVVPAFYALFASSFAAPILLESPGRPAPLIARTVRWTHAAVGRLSRLIVVLGVLTLLLYLMVLGTQILLLGTFVPGILGIDTTDAQLTFGGYAASLIFLFIMFLLLDFYWTAASVLLFYDLQARRLGSDLRQRMAALRTEGRR